MSHRPFDENLYSDAIKQYENRGKEFDSLMSVNEIQNFILIDKTLIII